MSDDIKRLEYTPNSYYNFHPGSHVQQGVEKGIELICDLLNRILSPEQSTLVLLETMAGKGSEIGRSFEELRTITGRGLEASLTNQCLIEESVAGWEELEVEVVRDSKGQMIAICMIENIDPIGVHRMQASTYEIIKKEIVEKM